MRLYVIRLTNCFTHISVELLSVFADYISVLPQFQQRRKIIAVTVFGTNNTPRQLKKLTAFSFRNQTKGFVLTFCVVCALGTLASLPGCCCQLFQVTVNQEFNDHECCWYETPAEDYSSCLLGRPAFASTLTLRASRRSLHHLHWTFTALCFIPCRVPA